MDKVVIFCDIIMKNIDAIFFKDIINDCDIIMKNTVIIDAIFIYDIINDCDRRRLWLLELFIFRLLELSAASLVMQTLFLLGNFFIGDVNIFLLKRSFSHW